MSNKMNSFLLFCALLTLSSCDDYSEGDSESSSLEKQRIPSLISPGSQQQIKGFAPIYISPDLEDILDQQQYNVYHEEVHGTILMPRISFGLNDDDQPIKDEDYGDYVNLVGGVDPKHYGRRRGRGGGRGGGGQGGGGGGQGNGGSGVRVFGNPLYNPTIEEMIPFSRIKDSPDTYIVMADDPVLAVDSVPKCQGDSGGDGGDGQGGGEEGSTEGGGEGEASSEGGERRRKRSVLF